MSPNTSPLAATTPSLDAHALRSDFPIFERVINGHPLAYLDSANSSQKPRQVLEAMDRLYTRSYSNVHRGVYTLGVEATEALESPGRRSSGSWARPRRARSSSPATPPRP